MVWSTLIGKEVKNRWNTSTRGTVVAVGCNKHGFRLLLQVPDNSFTEVDAESYERVEAE